MIFVGAGLVPARNGGKHKALPLQNANNFLIGINSIEFLGLTSPQPLSYLREGQNLPSMSGELRGVALK